MGISRYFHTPEEIRSQIRDVLAYTKERYGEAKAREYSALILDALRLIVREPLSGRQRHDIRAGVLTRDIKQPGRKARHVFLYEMTPDGSPIIYGFFHDGMDLPAQLQKRNPR